MNVRDRSRCEKETPIPAAHTRTTGDGTRSPGTRPDQESNLQLSGVRDGRHSDDGNHLATAFWEFSQRRGNHLGVRLNKCTLQMGKPSHPALQRFPRGGVGGSRTRPVPVRLTQVHALNPHATQQ